MMMDPHSIGEGNFLFFNGEIVQVTQIESFEDEEEFELEKIALRKKVGEQTVIYDWEDVKDSLKGIQLTSEWLLNFGFVDIGGCFQLSGIRIALRSSSSYGDTYLLSIEKGYLWFFRRIMYVHTLQNQFYPLTGINLNIKESI